MKPPPWPAVLAFAEWRLVSQQLRALLDFAARGLKAGLTAIVADDILTLLYRLVSS
jgi:hypothetical protein